MLPDEAIEEARNSSDKDSPLTESEVSEINNAINKINDKDVRVAFETLLNVLS